MASWCHGLQDKAPTNSIRLRLLIPADATESQSIDIRSMQRGTTNTPKASREPVSRHHIPEPMSLLFTSSLPHLVS